MKSFACLSKNPSLQKLFLILLPAAIIIISLSQFGVRLFWDYQDGGSLWKQGDWLINSQNQPIRRAFFGDLSIWISDFFRLDIVLTIISIQFIFVSILYYFTFRLVTKEKNGVLLLLLVSTSFYIFFWAAIPNGAGRKELVAFTALAIFTFGLNAKSHNLALVGLALFPISVLGHEAMILFLPAMGIIYLFHFDRLKSNTTLHVSFVLSCSVSLVAFYLGLKNAALADFSTVCQPLTARGASEEICDGAIKWLEFDLKYGVEAVRKHVGARMLVEFFFAYSLAIAPAIYIAIKANKKVLPFAITILSVVPFLPLYTFAIDYGRWMSFHIASIFFLYSAAISSEKIVFRTPIYFPSIIIFLCFGALISHRHTSALYRGGAAKRITEDAIRLFS